MAPENQGAAVSRPPRYCVFDGRQVAESHNELNYFNPFAKIRQTRNRLPHWQQNGAVYFITFRLVDALPKKLRQDLDYEREIWLHLHPQPWSEQIEREYHVRFSGKIEEWLDAGYGSCILRLQNCASIVDRTLQHFDGTRLFLISSVVMPNHVHALFVQNRDYGNERLLNSWKKYTSRRINALLNRSGPVWQRDYFDRLVRDDRHLANCVRYIRQNPAKARLGPNAFILHESELAKRIK